MSATRAGEGLTAEILAYLAQVKRFVPAREIFEQSELAEAASTVAAILLGLWNGKRVQRIKSPPGMQAQYLYAALGVPEPAEAIKAKPAPQLEPVPVPQEQALPKPAPIPKADANSVAFRVARWSDGTIVIEGAPGLDEAITLDKKHADQLLAYLGVPA